MRQSNWQNRYSAVINADIKLGKLNIGFESANQFLFGLENIFIIFLAATAVMDGELTIGMLFRLSCLQRATNYSNVGFDRTNCAI